MDHNVFAIAIMHLTLSDAAMLANEHFAMNHDTEPCSEPDPEVSSVTEYDVGATIRCPQPEWV